MKKNNRFKIDTYKDGGNKSEWISNKISEIMKEGKYPQDQAIAMAYSMYDNRHQIGGNTSNLKNIYDIKQGVYNPSMGQGIQLFYRDPADPKFNPATDLEFVKDENMPMVQQSQAYKTYLERKASNTAFTPTNLLGDYETPKFTPQKEIVNIRPNVRTEGERQGLPEGTYTKVYYKDNTVDYLDDRNLNISRQMPNFQAYYKKQQFQTGGWYENNPPMFTLPQETVSLSPEQLADETPMVNDMSIYQNPEQNYQQPPQFFNPYGGVDLATGVQALGRGIQSGNALDIVSGGLKTLAGTARNVFAGMGQENIRQESLKNYYDNQRDMLTQSYQDGGEIPERYKNMGFTKPGVKKESTRPGKKWMVLAKKGDDYKVVHGGYDGMKDFSQHGSEERKERFWDRMGGKDSAKANDPFSPLYWHKKFGTWQDGGEVQQDTEMVMQQVTEALQQGADPQEILQQLIQMGIPQDQAVQIIQSIMEQLTPPQQEEQAPMMKDGGYYLNQMKGKKIKDYKFNSETNSYDVEFE